MLEGAGHRILSVVRTAAPDVYGYLDYREYLKDFYEAEKGRSPTFSFRNFSRRIGVKSPSHMKRVIDGERSLTPTMVERYAKAIGLDLEATAYFGQLVQLNDARTPADREHAYQRLSASRHYRRAHRLDAHQAEYCAHWYIPAVRELAARSDFEDDPTWIADQISPAITVREAKGALDTLFELGLLVRDARGRVTQRDAVVSTGAQTKWVHVTRYHRAMLKQASDAIDHFRAEERDLSAVALGIDGNAMPRLKQRLSEFRQELLRDFSASDPDQIVQIGLQIFPLTKKRGAP